MKVKDLKVGDMIIWRWNRNNPKIHVITSITPRIHGNLEEIRVYLSPGSGFTDYPEVDIDNCIVVI